MSRSKTGVFHDIATFIISNRIPVRMVCIDVPKHRDKYVYPIPEYRLGLMLILDRICDYLEEVDDLGVVFGDYEKDELTHSHHSRFLQVADLLIYMAGRFEHAVMDETAKWHEKQVAEAWKNIKANADIKIQRWP